MSTRAILETVPNTPDAFMKHKFEYSAQFTALACKFELCAYVLGFARRLQWSSRAIPFTVLHAEGRRQAASGTLDKKDTRYAASDSVVPERCVMHDVSHMATMCYRVRQTSAIAPTVGSIPGFFPLVREMLKDSNCDGKRNAADFSLNIVAPKLLSCGLVL